MEIGIDPSTLNGLKIQRRQKYFHLMFIPTFPIGQYWALVGNGNQYAPTSEILMRLEQIQYSKKHLIWSFSLPLLIILGMLIFQLSEVAKQRRNQNYESAKNKEINALFSDKNFNARILKKYNSITATVDSIYIAYQTASAKDFNTNQLMLKLKALIYLKDSTPAQLEDASMRYENTTIIYLRNDGEFKYHPSLLDSNIVKVLEGKKSAGDFLSTDNWESKLESFENMKFLIIAVENNYLLPELENMKEFNSGVAYYKAYLYRLDSMKRLKTKDIYALNSDSIFYKIYNNYPPSDLKLRIRRNLDLNSKINIWTGFGYPKLLTSYEDF